MRGQSGLLLALRGPEWAVTLHWGPTSSHCPTFHSHSTPGVPPLTRSPKALSNQWWCLQYASHCVFAIKERQGNVFRISQDILEWDKNLNTFSSFTTLLFFPLRASLLLKLMRLWFYLHIFDPGAGFLSPLFPAQIIKINFGPQRIVL